MILEGLKLWRTMALLVATNPIKTGMQTTNPPEQWKPIETYWNLLKPIETSNYLQHNHVSLEGWKAIVQIVPASSSY